MLGESSTATVAHVVRAFASHAESRLFKSQSRQTCLNKGYYSSSVKRSATSTNVTSPLWWHYDSRKLKSRITVCVTISAKHCSNLQLFLLYVLVPFIPFFNFQIYEQVRMAQVLKVDIRKLKSRVTVCVVMRAKHCSKLQYLLLFLYVQVLSFPFFNFQIYMCGHHQY